MHIFDSAVDLARTWVKDMMVELPTEDPQKAWHALRAGLQALRDRISVEEAGHLSAQLPLVVRGMFFEGWNPTGKPMRLRHADEFLELVRERYAPRRDAAADDIVRATFRVLGKHVSAGEISDIVLTLPAPIADLTNEGFTNRERAER